VWSGGRRGRGIWKGEGGLGWTLLVEVLIVTEEEVYVVSLTAIAAFISQQIR
jgi:hypothetical protein